MTAKSEIDCRHKSHLSGSDLHVSRNIIRVGEKEIFCLIQMDLERQDLLLGDIRNFEKSSEILKTLAFTLLIPLSSCKKILCILNHILVVCHVFKHRET